ncbi:hypothetical protein BD408DRAFT_421258 [Parasitella parasitica]|nr:hypothetical protein BD408DRAFT_421258 [Parasitella parasitica]
MSAYYHYHYLLAFIFFNTSIFLSCEKLPYRKFNFKYHSVIYQDSLEYLQCLRVQMAGFQHHLADFKIPWA